MFVSQGSLGFEILSSIVDDEALRRIVEELGGCKVYIPKQSLKVRNQQLIDDFYKGDDANVLAIRYDLSCSRIEGIVADDRKRKITPI
jgi:Mor family transcriptional regulator